MAREKKMITVAPVDGRRVMLHDNPTRAILEQRTVPKHPHYLRAIARGDLALVDATATKGASKGAKKEG